MKQLKIFMFIHSIDIMDEFEGVSNSLYIPVIARIECSKRFPDFFYDSKAMELEQQIPAVSWVGSSEYAIIAFVSRYHVFDRIISSFINDNDECNIILLGAGFDTCYERVYPKDSKHLAKWYYVDFPQVIEARRKIIGMNEREINVPGDVLNPFWIEPIDCSLPSLIIVSGVFQFLFEEEVKIILELCKAHFSNGRILFDVTNENGLRYTNKLIKKTGVSKKEMHFCIDNPNRFAYLTDTSVLESVPLYDEPLKVLSRNLSTSTKVKIRRSNFSGKPKVVLLDLHRSKKSLED